MTLRGSGNARRPTARPRCSAPQLCTRSCCVSPALPAATCTPLSTCRRQAESFYFHPHSWRQGLGAKGGSAAFPFQPGQCPSRGCGIFHSGELWSLVRAEFGLLRHVTVAVTCGQQQQAPCQNQICPQHLQVDSTDCVCTVPDVSAHNPAFISLSFSFFLWQKEERWLKAEPPPSRLCSHQQKEKPPAPGELLTGAAARWSRGQDPPSASSPGAPQLCGAGRSSARAGGTASGSPTC